MATSVHLKPAKYNIRGQTETKAGVICRDNRLIGLTEKVSFRSYADLLRWMIHYEFNAHVRLVKMSSNMLDESLPEDIKGRFIFDRIVYACHNHDSSDRYVGGTLKTTKKQGKGCGFTFTVLYIRAINRLQMMSGCFYHSDGCVPSAASVANFNPRDPQSKKKVAILNDIAERYYVGNFHYVATKSIERFKGTNRDKNAPIGDDAGNDVPPLEYTPEIFQAMDEYVEATLRTAIASKSKKRRISEASSSSAAKRPRSAPQDPREISLAGEEENRPLSVQLQPSLAAPAPQMNWGPNMMLGPGYHHGGYQVYSEPIPKLAGQPYRPQFAPIQPLQPPVQAAVHHEFYWQHPYQVQYGGVPETQRFGDEMNGQDVQHAPQGLGAEYEEAGFGRQDLYQGLFENNQEVPDKDVEEENGIDDFDGGIYKLAEDWGDIKEFLSPPMSKTDMEHYLNRVDNGQDSEPGLSDLDVPVHETQYFSL